MSQSSEATFMAKLQSQGQSMNFLDQISSFATARQKPKYQVKRDPRANFIATAQETVELIQGGADAGTWFKREGDKYVITFRNGKRVVYLRPGMEQHVAPNAENAINLLNIVIKAAQAGELDAAIADAGLKKTS